MQVSQEKEQNENVGQTLKKLSNLLKQALEQIPELQGIVQDCASVAVVHTSSAGSHPETTGTRP